VAGPPTRPVLRARYERRRSEVVRVAARVFAERGYHATTMQDLAEATGLAAGGLYHYIGSKERLLIAICDDLMQPLLDAADDVLAGAETGADALRALLRLWVAHVIEHREHMLVFGQERHVIEREPRWRDVVRARRAFEGLLDEVLERGEADGSLAFADRRLALLALLGMVNHTPQWYRPRGRLGPREIADGFLGLVA
jgi:AcrR family transcriptional regulator